MSMAPRKPAERVVFYQNKTGATGAFKVNAVAIGTTTAAVDALNALADAASAALADQAAKRDAAKTATQVAKQAVAAMSAAGADVIQSIRAKAGSVADAGAIWSLADLPEPATPTPVGPPGTPKDFKVELAQTGALQMSWKIQNPANATGTVYQVARQIAAGGPMTILGATGRKEFLDETLPSGLSQVTYKITAIRSTKQGLPAEVTVKFGTTGSGEMTATVVSAPKLAA